MIFVPILALGDDEQNIYRFGGVSDLSPQFEEDYAAQVHDLGEKYRSTAHITAIANVAGAGNLAFFSWPVPANPHLPLRAGDFLLRRTGVATIVNEQDLLGMEAFFLDFVGMKSAQHPCRQASQRIVAGRSDTMKQGARS